jgi:hypothetical protein
MSALTANNDRLLCRGSLLNPGCELWLRSAAKETFAPEPSAHRLLLFRRGDLTRGRFGFELGLRQKPKARLAPREVNADIEQSVGPPAWAGKFHDRTDSIGLAYNERDLLSRDMVWSGVDAQNQIAGADSVAHGMHSLRGQKIARGQQAASLDALAETGVALDRRLRF